MATELNRRLLRELRALDKGGTYRDQADVELVDENAAHWRVTLRPAEGSPFHGAALVFEFEFQVGYPAQPPKVSAMQPILHPNIAAPSICFNQLQSGDGWHAEMTADVFINGLLWLLDNPNFNSVLNADAGNSITWRRDLCESLYGEVVRGIRYPKFLDRPPEPHALRGWAPGPVRQPAADSPHANKLRFFQQLIDMTSTDDLARTGMHFAVGTRRNPAGAGAGAETEDASASAAAAASASASASAATASASPRSPRRTEADDLDSGAAPVPEPIRRVERPRAAGPA